MNILIVYAVIGVGFFFLFSHLRNKTIQKVASYKLYSVRDELICLVAEDKLQEEGKIFQYYYKNINLLLKQAPDVGTDNAMAALKEANRRAAEMLRLVEKESKEVSDVIADYYADSRDMMLAHSSLLRMFYLFVVKYQIPKLFNNLIPSGTQEKIKTVRFANYEEERFRQVAQQQAA